MGIHFVNVRRNTRNEEVLTMDKFYMYRTEIDRFVAWVDSLGGKNTRTYADVREFADYVGKLKDRDRFCISEELLNDAMSEANGYLDAMENGAIDRDPDAVQAIKPVVERWRRLINTGHIVIPVTTKNFEPIPEIVIIDISLGI